MVDHNHNIQPEYVNGIFIIFVFDLVYILKFICKEKINDHPQSNIIFVQSLISFCL